MKDKIDILKSEVKISDVVMNTTEETFAKILEESKQKENEKIQAMPAVRKRNGFKKRWIALVAVAVLAVGTLSVGAAGGFDTTLLKFMGIKGDGEGNLKTQQVEIGVSDTCKGTDYAMNSNGEKKEVTMTVAECMGDSNVAYVRIDTDYTLSGELEFNPDNIRLETELVRIYSDKSMTKESEAVFDTVKMQTLYENDKISFLWKIEGCDDINQKYLYFTSENICLMNDIPGQEDTTLFEGSWELTWQFDYDAKNLASYPLDVDLHLPYAKAREIGGSAFRKGLDVHLNKIELTPMTITLYGVADFDPEKEELENQGYRIEKITYNDGTILLFDESYLDGTTDAYRYNGIFFFDTYTGDKVTSELYVTELFGQDIDIEKVESITIDGVDIKVK